jgi:hypothetical protein
MIRQKIAKIGIGAHSLSCVEEAPDYDADK